jgi:hypothetical protein
MQKRLPRTVAGVCLALLVFLSPGPWATAQNSPPDQEFFEHLTSLVRSKWEKIELEAATAKEEWAGRYRAYEGPTITTDLSWSPTSGFIVWWYNCSRPGSERVNHGGAVLQNGSLQITPEVSETTPGSFSLPTEYVPVKWGAQHYLIPRDQVLRFVYAVNAGVEFEIEKFLQKVDDYEKQRKGRPAVPPEYARYLGMKPISASISRVHPKTPRWYPNVVLNVGKRARVIPQMKFYHWRRGGPFVALEVISVGEHTSEAAVVSVGGDDDKLQLKSGWRFSSRAPKGSANFLP